MQVFIQNNSVCAYFNVLPSNCHTVLYYSVPCTVDISTLLFSQNILSHTLNILGTLLIKPVNITS